MLPFEFTIKGPPVSLQTKNKRRLRQWKADLAAAATALVPPGSNPVGTPVEINITYYYEGATPDIDNIIKPIQDSLRGVVYLDDNQVVRTMSQKKDINGSYRIRGASALIVTGFSEGSDFLHVRISENLPNDELE